MLNVDRLCQHQVRADAISLGHTRLPFDYSDGKRALIGTGISRALKKQRRVLFVLAVDDDCVEALRHQLFDRGKRLLDGFHGEVQFGEDLTDDSGELFVGTEEQGLVTHNEAILGKVVGTSKLRG